MVYNVKYKLLFLMLWVSLSIAIPSRYVLDEDEDRGTPKSAVIDQGTHASTRHLKLALHKGIFGRNRVASILFAIPNKTDATRIIAKYGQVKCRQQNSGNEEGMGTEVDPDDESPMIISKLSDRSLISLLQKKTKHGIFDVFDVDGLGRNKNKKKNLSERKKPSSPVETQDSKQGSAFFRLDDKEVEPFNFNTGADPKYLAHQKIQNLLYSRPTQNLVEFGSDETDENKELLFDILTEQLKKLCCKSRKTKQKKTKPRLFEPLLNIRSSNDGKYAKDTLQYEQMFLIINDEIQSDQPSEIVYVDPESLNKNSSVVLLGPITTPLSDSQLQIVMNRITSELSKPEYVPLLQELSEGKYNKDNTRLIKSMISGSNTRRYIKPHRCRTRYPLSQGPKWLICTGYLNINTPSLYD